MAKRKKFKDWGHRRETVATVFRPMPQRILCTSVTVFWLAERVGMDIAMPGMRVGDVPGGDKILGAWEGVPIVERDIPHGVILVERGDDLFHLRLDEGKRHNGHPDQCNDGVCIAAAAMGA